MKVKLLLISTLLGLALVTFWQRLAIEESAIQKNSTETINSALVVTEAVTDNTESIAEEKPQIFFDIRQILQSSGSAAAKVIGVSNLFWYSVKHKCKPNHIELQSRLFKFMDFCTKKPRSTARYNDELLPAIMHEWICGKLSAKELADQILKFESEAQVFFQSEEEKKLVLAILNLFQSDTLAKLQKPHNKMLKLFEDTCRAHPGRVYLLSNWDLDSANLIRQKFPQIFGCIPEEHILFSGKIGYAKPEVNLYRWITSKFKLKPENCILIEECPESIAIAKSQGWKTIQYKDENTAQVAKKLNEIK